MYAEVHDAIIKALTTKMRHANSSFFLNAIFNGQNATSHVIDQHVPLTGRLLIQAICDRCGGGFVDNPEHLQSRNIASFVA